MDWFGTYGFLGLVTIGFLIVVIENQEENRMVKQWVPLLIKIKWYLDVFY